MADTIMKLVSTEQVAFDMAKLITDKEMGEYQLNLDNFRDYFLTLFHDCWLVAVGQEPKTKVRPKAKA